MTPAREQILTLPNLLSLVRVGFVPVIVVLLEAGGQGCTLAAAWVFFVAGLTDLADGMLARWMKKVTVVGKYLDPVADKLLICSTMVMLTALERLPGWMVVVVICRELVITGMRAVALAKGFNIYSNRWGKSKTVTQVLACWLLLLDCPSKGIKTHSLGMAVMWIAIALTVTSAVSYTLEFNRRWGEATEGLALDKER